MRLVLFVNNFPLKSQTFVVNKFVGLLERGWDVHVVCRDDKPADWAFFPALQQRVNIRQRIHSGLTNIVEIDTCLYRLQPDVLHFEFGAYAAHHMYLKELLGCKVTVNFRGYDINYEGLDQPDFYRDVWERADGLLFSGHDLWLRAQRRGCPQNVNYVNIPPAIDVNHFQPDGRKYGEVGVAERPLRLLGVGRLVWKKGYEFALVTVRQLVDQGVACEYRIIGEGMHEPAIRHLTHQLGLDQVVQFWGGVPADEVRAQMQWADVLLHTAVSEGFCVAAIEAQAMQLPVVCADADGLRENIADGETGFIVPRRHPEALAEKVAMLARDATLRRQMGMAGRKRAETKFHLADQMEAFISFFRQVNDG